jgi:PilZ domain
VSACTLRTTGRANTLFRHVQSFEETAEDKPRITEMEKRAHYRQPVAFQVRVIAMANPEFSASGETLDISESGIGVCLPLQFMPGSLVQIEIADSVLHGFVAYSRDWHPSSEPSFARNKSWIGGFDLSGAAELPPERSFFRTGIEVVEALIGTSGLSQLLKATVEEKIPTLEVTYSGPA